MEEHAADRSSRSYQKCQGSQQSGAASGEQYLSRVITVKQQACAPASEREAGLLPVVARRLRQLSQLVHTLHLCGLHKQAAPQAQRAPLTHRPHVGVCARGRGRGRRRLLSGRAARAVMQHGAALKQGVRPDRASAPSLPPSSLRPRTRKHAPAVLSRSAAQTPAALPSLPPSLPCCRHHTAPCLQASAPAMLSRSATCAMPTTRRTMTAPANATASAHRPAMKRSCACRRAAAAWRSRDRGGARGRVGRPGEIAAWAALECRNWQAVSQPAVPHPQPSPPACPPAAHTRTHAPARPPLQTAAPGSCRRRARAAPRGPGSGRGSPPTARARTAAASGAAPCAAPRLRGAGQQGRACEQRAWPAWVSPSPCTAGGTAGSPSARARGPASRPSRPGRPPVAWPSAAKKASSRLAMGLPTSKAMGP